MSGRKPEYAFHHTPFFTLRRFPEYRGLLRFGPVLSAVVRTEHCRSQMAGFSSHQDRASITRIGNHVVDDVAQIIWAFKFPGVPGLVAAIDECALACSHQ